jgi:hypothetical protein
VAAHAGRVRVNIGGDPGRDDYGLPPVDIEIPDDARELDRDVQAYHRELRAQRWRAITGRLHGPLTRDGMVLPMLAGCLALTLLAGTLLTMFTAGLRITPPPASQSRRLLPDAIVLVGGTQTPLRSLRGSVLALVPPSCGCIHLRQLANQASVAGVQIYIVGTSGVPVATLAKRTGLDARHAVEDSENALATSYHPTTLTAVLVNNDGSVARVVSDQGQGFQLTSALRLLAAHGSQGLSRPGRGGMMSIAAGYGTQP